MKFVHMFLIEPFQKINIFINEKIIKAMDFNYQSEDNTKLSFLEKNKDNREHAMLYKLKGMKVQNVKAVQSALMSHFKLKYHDFGGIKFFEEVNSWIFYGFPKEIKKAIAFNKNSTIKIMGWTEEEISSCYVSLIIYSNDVSKEKKEHITFRMAAKKLLKAFRNNNRTELEEGFFIPSCTRN